MNCPLVTIYITNYNYGRFIKRALDSVFSQTFKNFELIIIDDGSTDDSLEIINREIQGNIEVTLITQQNLGLNKSNNVALDLAKGKYIVRLDADDYFDQRAIEIMVSTLENNSDLGIVFPDYYLVDELENIIQLYRRNDFKEKVSLYDRPAHGACTMIRVEFLKKAGGYNEAFSCQDGFDLWLKMISKHQIENIGLPLFYYRHHGSNLTKNQEKIFTSRGKILKCHFEKKNYQKLKTVAVIPVRGENINEDFLALKKVGDKELIKWSIDSALTCPSIDEIIISCESRDLIEFLINEYPIEKSNKLHWHLRSKDLTGVHKDISETLFVIDKTYEHLKAEAYCLLYVEAPFRDERYIEQAIHTLSFYPVDCVDGVVNDTSFFYKHDGSGLVPINARPFFQFERDDIFKRSGGIHVVKKEFLKSGKQLLEGKVGHILLDELAGFYIRSAFDLKIALSLAEKNNDRQKYNLRGSNEFTDSLEVN